MSRTNRNSRVRDVHWARRVINNEISFPWAPNYSERMRRCAIRILKKADGCCDNSTCGSAIEGVLNKWDDYGPGNKKTKRFASKDRRNWDKRVVRKELDNG